MKKIIIILIFNWLISVDSKEVDHVDQTDPVKLTRAFINSWLEKDLEKIESYIMPNPRFLNSCLNLTKMKSLP